MTRTIKVEDALRMMRKMQSGGGGGTGDVSLKGAILKRTKSISGYSFSSKQYRSISIPYDAVEGYTPIVYLVACTSHSAIRVFNFYTSSGNVVFEAVNQNETSLTANFSIYLLYISNDLMG